MRMQYYVVAILIIAVVNTEARKCPKRQCKLRCKSKNRERDDNGCWTCKCKKPAKEFDSKNLGECPELKCDNKCKPEQRERDEDGCMTCRCTEKFGDLRLTGRQADWANNQGKYDGGGARDTSSVVRKWTTDITADGYYRIPFSYSDEVFSHPEHQNNIKKALSIVNALTCIDFQPATKSDRDQLHFTVGRGCWSYIGRNGGKQEVSIDKGCYSTGTILHELMHALGFWHEQSRGDRDVFVEVLKQNIISGMRKNFFKKDPSLVESFNSGYDYNSVMHYSGYSFSKNNHPTIINLQTGEAVVSQRIMLSSEDQYQLRAMYNCNGKRRVPETTDCMHSLDQGASYRGTASVTESGYACQRWDRQSPHSHGFDPSHITGAGLENNYCRNPDIKDKPWCYTTNPNKEWEYCSIPTCDNAVPELVQPQPPTNNRGSWSDWSSWGQCSSTCGSGNQYRTRHCIGADVGSEQCPGEHWESNPCGAPCPSGPAFPATGNWQPWMSWSACDAVCVQGNSGHRYRVRACSNAYCEGDTIEEEVCSQPSCPTYDSGDCFNENNPAAYRGTLAVAKNGASCIPWKNAKINVDVFPNADLRNDYCRSLGGSDGPVCFVKKRKTKACAPVKCQNSGAYWSDYSGWSACSASCDGGFKYRTRNCIQGAVGEGSCIGDVVQAERCNIEECSKIF